MGIGKTAYPLKVFITPGFLVFYVLTFTKHIYLIKFYVFCDELTHSNIQYLCNQSQRSKDWQR